MLLHVRNAYAAMSADLTTRSEALIVSVATRSSMEVSRIRPALEKMSKPLRDCLSDVLVQEIDAILLTTDDRPAHKHFVTVRSALRQCADTLGTPLQQGCLADLKSNPFEVDFDLSYVQPRLLALASLLDEY